MFRIVTSLMAASVLALAGAAAAQTMQESIERAAAMYTEWMEVMAEITRDVEIEERDVRDFLDHWQDLEQLELGDMQEENPAEFKKNFEESLADPRYRSWAAARGLDPDAYLGRSMRIQSLFMLQQSAAQAEMAEQQHAEHAAMVEQQCKEVDAETCQQMRDAVAASKSMAEAMVRARQKIRPATPGERALLQRYAAQIEAVMMDDDAEGDYEDYEDLEDYEDYEEDDGEF